MADERRGQIISFLMNNMMGVVAVVVVIALVVPLPKVFIDMCMALNLSLSLIVLLTVIYTPRSSDFTQFPRMIQFAMLFGIGINISSTRLILTSPASAVGYSSFQSAMVQVFANIVTAGSVPVGMIIFVILIVVQMVVTKGATRVSEVEARFALDSMNTKMFDIDNQVNSGAISDADAREQKAALRREIDFYSRMDGASKFVSGNVKAGIFITVVNMIGGIIAGMNPNIFGISGMNAMGIGDAFNTYARLTIGDGLMSQLPSLMLSFATGLIVTGTATDEKFDKELFRELSVSPYVYSIVGGCLIVMGVLFRARTQFLLIPLGALFVYLGVRMSRAEQTEAEKKAIEAATKERTKAGGAASADADSIALLDPLSLELGYALIPLVDKEKGAELLERVTRIRREAALDMGLVVPRIRIVDNMTLDPNEYCFKIRGIEAGRAKIRLGYYMCMNAGGVKHEIDGEKTRDPAFGMQAIWVPESRRAEAEQAGYAVVDPPTIIATHLTQIIRMNAADILSRQEVSTIIAKVKETNPVVVDEVMNLTNAQGRKFSYGDIEKVLRALLREQVSIRNIVVILETLANYGHITFDTWALAEKVREALGLQICMQYVDADKKLRVMNLSQEFAELLLSHQVQPSDGSRPYAALDPVDGRKWIRSVSDAFARVSNMGFQPIILCPSAVRLLAKVSTEREQPGIVVISDREVLAAGTGIGIEVLGEIADGE